MKKYFPKFIKIVQLIFFLGIIIGFHSFGQNKKSRLNPYESYMQIQKEKEERGKKEPNNRQKIMELSVLENNFRYERDSLQAQFILAKILTLKSDIFKNDKLLTIINDKNEAANYYKTITDQEQLTKIRKGIKVLVFLTKLLPNSRQNKIENELMLFAKMALSIGMNEEVENLLKNLNTFSTNFQLE